MKSASVINAAIAGLAIVCLLSLAGQASGHCNLSTSQTGQADQSTSSDQSQPTDASTSSSTGDNQTSQGDSSYQASQASSDSSAGSTTSQPTTTKPNDDLVSAASDANAQSASTDSGVTKPDSSNQSGSSRQDIGQTLGTTLMTANELRQAVRDAVDAALGGAFSRLNNLGINVDSSSGTTTTTTTTTTPAPSSRSSDIGLDDTLSKLNLSGGSQAGGNQLDPQTILTLLRSLLNQSYQRSAARSAAGIVRPSTKAYSGIQSTTNGRSMNSRSRFSYRV